MTVFKSLAATDLLSIAIASLMHGSLSVARRHDKSRCLRFQSRTVPRGAGDNRALTYWCTELTKATRASLLWSKTGKKPMRPRISGHDAGTPTRPPGSHKTVDVIFDNTTSEDHENRCIAR